MAKQNALGNGMAVRQLPLTIFLADEPISDGAGNGCWPATMGRLNSVVTVLAGCPACHPACNSDWRSSLHQSISKSDCSRLALDTGLKTRFNLAGTNVFDLELPCY